MQGLLHGLQIRLQQPRAALFALSCLALAASFLIGRAVVGSKLGMVWIAIRDAELAYCKDSEVQARQELERLKAEREQIGRQGGDQILERLTKLGVVFVVYHPGAGHLTIPLQDIGRYQDGPMAYVAAKCFVSESQYSQWLAHYQQSSCDAKLPSGERCAMPIDRVDTPSRFVVGDSNCCARHKSAGRQRG